MSTQPGTPVQPPPSVGQTGSILDRLAGQDRQVGFAVIGVGLALLAIPIGVSLAYGSSAAHIAVWGGVLAALALVAGTVLLNPVSGQVTPTQRLRLVLLTLGGSAGFFTAILGLTLPFTAKYQDVFTGGFLEWRKNPGALLWVGLTLFGGLVLMFLSLQLARGLERGSMVLRRLVYGYNAVVSSLTLLIILTLINVLSYVTLWPFDVMGQTIDWTRNKQFTLNESFVNLLQKLDQPVHVYAILPQGIDRIYEIDSLLKNARDTVPRYFHYETLSRDSDFPKVTDLQKKFNFIEPSGLLVVYGDEDSKPTSDFVPFSKLRDARRRFIGENALYQSIDFLTQGSKKPTVYFTQGNGELSFNEGPEGKPNESMSSLIDLLSTGNFEAKELRYDGKESAAQLAERLLKEADVVVVARPTNSLPKPLVAALRDYSRGTSAKRGKLILLFDAISDQDGKMVPTGMEAFLAENHIYLQDNRLIRPQPKQESDQRTPLQFLGMMDPRSANNPIVKGLAPRQEGRRPMAFLFQNARSLDILPPNRQPGLAPIQTESIVIIPINLFVWGATNLNGNPIQLADQRANQLENDEKEVNRAFGLPPLVVAASVAQSERPQMPMGMDEESAPTGKQRPLMVVMGNGSWISNQFLQSGQRDRSAANWTLFSNCLTWLRERPDVGEKIDPREPGIFQVDAGVKSQISVLRLVFLPVILMLVAIIGLGVGVWMVRRR